MPIYRVSVTHSAYVQASSAKAAEEFSDLILDNEIDADVEVAPVNTNELGWFPHSLIYTEDGADLTVAEAFELHDITRCLGRGCHQRQHCARYAAPVPEGVMLSWVSTLNPERAPECPYIITEKHND